MMRALRAFLLALGVVSLRDAGAAEAQSARLSKFAAERACCTAMLDADGAARKTADGTSELPPAW